MKQKTGLKSLNQFGCHISIVNNGKVIPLVYTEADGYVCYLKEGDQFEIRIAYFGFNAIRYKMYLDGKPMGMVNGKELTGALSFIKNDVHDVWQNFYQEQNKWVFDGNPTTVELKVCPATLEIKSDRGVSNSNVEKTAQPQLIDYKIKGDWSKSEEVVFKLMNTSPSIYAQI